MEEYQACRKRAPPSVLQAYFASANDVCQSIMGEIDQVRGEVGSKAWAALEGEEKENRISSAFVLQATQAVDYSTEMWGKTVVCWGTRVLPADCAAD